MRLVAITACLMVMAAEAAAEQRYALVISGASGGQKYAEQMAGWRNGIRGALVDRYGFSQDDVRIFVDETVKTGGEQGTAQNVRAAIATLRKQLTKDDVLFIVLLGHGTYDGEAAKFNLVGPDLTAADWRTLLNDLPGRLVMVNTTAASFPFLEPLSGPNRIVITATDSAAQKYATVFPDYFVTAMNEASTDLDKNGRTSIFEVFAAASLAVKQHYEKRGQLLTERALFDDNGDGVGLEADATGPDGALARTFYLDAELPAAADNPELAALIARRRELEAEAEVMKAKKASMPGPVWEAEYEKLMLELARVSREIKAKS